MLITLKAGILLPKSWRLKYWILPWGLSFWSGRNSGSSLMLTYPTVGVIKQSNAVTSLSIRRLWGKRGKMEEFFRERGVYNPEISDHHMVYASLKERAVQHKTRILRVRSYKNFNSLWTGLWSSGELGRGKSEKACGQAFGTAVPRHPLCIRSWCKFLLARTLTVERSDWHRLFGRHVTRVWK